MATKVVDANMKKQRRNWGQVTVAWNEKRHAWYYRVQYKGRRYTLSTDVRSKSDRPAAMRVARRLAEAIRGGKQEVLDEVSRRRAGATVEDVVERWLVFGPKTAKAGKARFERYVREEFGANVPGNALLAEVLDANRFRHWVDVQVGAGRAAAGIRSDVNSIKSLFAPGVVHYYQDLQVPDVAAFRAVSFSTRRRSGADAGKAVAFRIIEPRQLRAMEEAAEALRTGGDAEGRRLWAVFALMRWCGLRNNETAQLRWDWIREGAKGPVLEFVKRQLPGGEEYVPKGRDGSVPIRRELLEQLREAFGDEGEFVIPRANKTDAENLYQRAINEWARGFLKNRQGSKVSYALRGQFGAEIAMRSGLEVASRMLRHASFSTTWAHYHDLVTEPDPL